MFQAIASNLIYGKRDAVLVDAYMTVKQAEELVDWVAASGKNLTTIYVTTTVYVTMDLSAYSNMQIMVTEFSALSERGYPMTVRKRMRMISLSL